MLCFMNTFFFLQSIFSNPFKKTNYCYYVCLPDCLHVLCRTHCLRRADVHHWAMNCIKDFCDPLPVIRVLSSLQGHSPQNICLRVKLLSRVPGCLGESECEASERIGQRMWGTVEDLLHRTKQSLSC